MVPVFLEISKWSPFKFKSLTFALSVKSGQTAFGEQWHGKVDQLLNSDMAGKHKNKTQITKNITLKFGQPQNLFPLFLAVLTVLNTALAPQ